MQVEFVRISTDELREFLRNPKTASWETTRRKKLENQKKQKVFLFHVLSLSKQRCDYFKYPIFYPIYLFSYDNHLFKTVSSRVNSKVQAVFHLPRGKSTRSFGSTKYTESVSSPLSPSLSLSLSLCMKRCWGVHVSKTGTVIFEFGTRECARFRDRRRGALVREIARARLWPARLGR